MATCSSIQDFAFNRREIKIHSGKRSTSAPDSWPGYQTW
jgi:hypothetical protein